MKIVIPGRPITKKNHGRIVYRGKKPIFLPSKFFVEYQFMCGWFLKGKKAPPGNLNIKCLYFMPTRGIVDLVGLLQATDDILTHYGVIEDDNSRIIGGHDGSRVFYDKENPRAEIYIEVLNDESDGSGH